MFHSLKIVHQEANNNGTVHCAESARALKHIADKQIPSIDFLQISNEQLLQLCCKFGMQARLWRQKFIGLLPEVNRRHLYERRGCSSIIEFAAKIAGVSREQVFTALNLDRLFEDKPLLRKMLINGEVSINKLVRITAVVTKANEEFWAHQVRLLPSRALETLVRDEKTLQQMIASAKDDGAALQTEEQKYDLRNDQLGLPAENHGLCGDLPVLPAENQNGLQKGLFKSESVHVQREEAIGIRGEKTGPEADQAKKQNIYARTELELAPAIKAKLLELQNKGIDINALLAEFLEKREVEIAQEKTQIATEIYENKSKLHIAYDRFGKKQIATEIHEMQAACGQPEKGQKLNSAANCTDARVQENDEPIAESRGTSRYIPQKIKNIILKEHGTKCSIPTCNKPALTFHHTQRFALSQNHDPHFLAPLCQSHHIIAHSIDQKFQQKLYNSCQKP